MSADEELLLAVQYSLQTSHLPDRVFCECFQRRCFLFYQEAIDYISNIERAGSDYGIERMRELLDLLGEPDEKLKFVHVAGTNGKGSVCAYLTSILKEAGYRVGTYNSPSVFCYNERWLIDGKMLSDEDVAKYLTAVRECVEQENIMRSAFGIDLIKPTAFEIETAVAMLAFFEKECDICVLETGLGGRWDATNAIRHKELAVITPIGLDHCGVLGNTLGEIASEKSAIIKDCAVTLKQLDEIMNEIYHPYVFEEGKRKDIKADVHLCKDYTVVSSDVSGQSFEYDGESYRIKMLGKHQLGNAVLAIEAVKMLCQKHFDISEQDIKNGLEKTLWKARFQIVENAQSALNMSIPSGKTLVFDGSHNPQGAQTLADGIGEYFKDRRVHLVLGMLKDKDVDGVCKIIAPLARKITAVTPPSPRAMDACALKEIAQKYCHDVTLADDIKGGVKSALCGDCDVVILCGSLTLFKDML